MHISEAMTIEQLEVLSQRLKDGAEISRSNRQNIAAWIDYAVDEAKRLRDEMNNEYGEYFQCT